MCGRYQLEDDWSDFPEFKIPEEFAPSDDVRPTESVPIVRLDDEGRWLGEMRRWGFLRTWPGPSGKWVKKQLFNAVGEELGSKRSFKAAFGKSHCLVPMSAWYEWPLIDGKKTRVRIGLKARKMFGVAGLFETSKHPDTGDPVATFTVVTVPPNEILGTAHDRAPLVLLERDYQAWLEGGPLAQSLIGAHPDNDAFFVEPVNR
ncbi:MAG: SOS response-associated peptidase family protein [Burkholderiaceae bacterium]